MFHVFRHFHRVRLPTTNDNGYFSVNFCNRVSFFFVFPSGRQNLRIFFFFHAIRLGFFTAGGRADERRTISEGARSRRIYLIGPVKFVNGTRDRWVSAVGKRLGQPAAPRQRVTASASPRGCRCGAGKVGEVRGRGGEGGEEGMGGRRVGILPVRAAGARPKLRINGFRSRDFRRSCRRSRGKTPRPYNTINK